MKKWLLFAGMLLALSANAQNLKLCSNGVELTDGQTVDITSTAELDGFGTLLFDPKLTLSTSQSAPITLSLKFTSSDATPELSDMDDALLEYRHGVGDAKLQICSQNFVGNCIKMDVGQSNKWTKTLSTSSTENLLTELAYRVGYEVKSLTELTIKSEFEVGITQGSETMKVKFVVNNDPASINAISADKSGTKSACYDLQGRKLTKPEKGINIINGKKVLVK